jgi:mannose-6-phosphate isomerase
MHLFEACIDLYASASASKYVTLGAEIVDLLLDRFIDRTTGTLTEFFDRKWQPDPIRGHIVEPGHHFEWVWLIHRWLRLIPEEMRGPRSGELRGAAAGLLRWALDRGIDQARGGVFDEVDCQGKVLKESKRIWPLTEALKAARFAQADQHGPSDLALVSERLLNLLFENYLRPETGTWTETLDRELRPLTDYHPATTVYHITMAARELAWIQQWIVS